MREECPMAKRKRRKYTAEFKADAVRLCRSGDKSIPQVARDLDLTDSALREWVKRAEVDEGSDDDGHRDRARRLAGTVMGRSVAVARLGVDDPRDDVALDEALLLPSGLAQRGGGEAIELAHRAGRGLVNACSTLLRP
jgi:transposase